MAEKIKAINPEIIVSGDVEKPYYQIKYYDTADSTYHIGFGSYNYGNVLGWLKECFEPIKADEQPVVHGHWIKTNLMFASSPTGRHGNVHVCSKCGEQSGVGFKTPYCAICGAKMDEEVSG